MKRWLLFVFFIFVFSSLWIQLGPIRTIWGIQDCVRNGRAEDLGRYIDFPSVRSDLKTQIRSKVQASNILDAEEPMHMLFSQLSTQFTDNLVDGFLNPETIASLVNASASGNSGTVKEGTEKGVSIDFIQSDKLAQEWLNRFEFSYLSWGQFEVLIKKADSEFNQARVLFERRGINWVITHFTLPIDFSI